MKKFLFLAFLVTLLFNACSKKNNNQPKQPANTVTINGTIYSTVVIGSQTWTSVNYNGPGGENYNNGANNPTYGKLYTYPEADAIVLPTGWRVPTETDFNNLLAATGATNLGGSYLASGNQSYKLMSKTDWTIVNGTDSLGFNAEPGGYFRNGDQFYGLGTLAIFLSTTPYFVNGTFPFILAIQPDASQVTSGIALTTDRGSVRFVKDN